MISTRYFDTLSGGEPIVETITCMRKFFSGLCDSIVPRSGSGCDGYSSNKSCL